MAAASSRTILKSSSAALNLVTKSNLVQLPLRVLPIVESSVSRFTLFNQKLDSDQKMPMQQPPVWIERPQSISEEILMAGYSRKYQDIEVDDDDFDDEVTVDDSDIEMIDEEEDDDEDDEDEFEDEEDEFVKTKVRTRSHRDL